MLIPQFVAGEHELFGGNESEDIRTISYMTPICCTTSTIEPLIFDHLYLIYYMKPI